MSTRTASLALPSVRVWRAVSLMHAPICPVVIRVEMAGVPFCASAMRLWFYVLSNVVFDDATMRQMGKLLCPSDLKHVRVCTRAVRTAF